MKENDMSVSYRPELSKKLEEILNLVIKLYRVNFRRAYYLLLALTYENENTNTSQFLKKVADCFNGSFLAESTFYECYESELEKKYNIRSVSETRAAWEVFKVYIDSINKQQEELVIAGLSKYEKYLVNSFFEYLKRPAKNPNLDFKNGETCYYDRIHGTSFRNDLLLSLDYMSKDCRVAIEMFNTPD